MAPASSISRIRFRISTAFAIVWSFISPSQLHDVTLAGPDVIALFDRKYENAPISDLSRPCGLDDGFHSLVRHFIRNDQFEHDFRKKCDTVFRSAIDRFMALLPAMPAHFCNGHAG